jgi:hypothetical protein
VQHFQKFWATIHLFIFDCRLSIVDCFLIRRSAIDNRQSPHSFRGLGH